MKFGPGFFAGILSLTGLFGASMWASKSNLGVTKPSKKTISIREGSSHRSRTSGHRRQRYFVGGGLHRGK